MISGIAKRSKRDKSQQCKSAPLELASLRLMWKSRRTRVIGLGLICIFGAALGLLIVFMRSPPMPPPPNPNGYDDLRSAEGIMIALNDMSDLGHDDLRALMSSNAPALQRVRLGLSRRCAVPTETAIANFGAVQAELMDHRALVRLLAAEGRLAEMEDRPADAARSYVDAIRLGQAISHGLIIYRLIGIACETTGERPLVKLLPRLTCEQIRPLVRELEMIDRDAVTWEEIRASENRYARAQYGPIALLADLWAEQRAMK